MLAKCLKAMIVSTESCPSVDAILSSEEPEAPVVAWTLDELDDSADLASLRPAVATINERYA